MSDKESTETKDYWKRNPLSRVQHDIAERLRANEWMQAHRVEIIEQNAQALSFLLQRSIAQIANVVIVVGVDGMTNNPPALEAETTLTATENVIMNRTSADAATALDAIQVAIEVVDGLEWCFQRMEHETPTQGILQATATFRGQVTRDTTTDYNP